MNPPTLGLRDIETLLTPKASRNSAYDKLTDKWTLDLSVNEFYNIAAFIQDPEIPINILNYVCKLLSMRDVSMRDVNIQDGFDIDYPPLDGHSSQSKTYTTYGTSYSSPTFFLGENKKVPYK